MVLTYVKSNSNITYQALWTFEMTNNFIVLNVLFSLLAMWGFILLLLLLRKHSFAGN